MYKLRELNNLTTLNDIQPVTYFEGTTPTKQEKKNKKNKTINQRGRKINEHFANIKTNIYFSHWNYVTMISNTETV